MKIDEILRGIAHEIFQKILCEVPYGFFDRPLPLKKETDVSFLRKRNWHKCSLRIRGDTIRIL